MSAHEHPSDLTESMRKALALVRPIVPALVLPAGLWFIDPNVIAQSKPMSLAYQVSMRTTLRLLSLRMARELVVATLPS